MTPPIIRRPRLPHSQPPRSGSFHKLYLLSEGRQNEISSSHVWVWELDIKKAEHWRTDAFELWCWERLLRSPMDCKESKPIHPKGNQSWIFFGRTDAKTEPPILWQPDAKNLLHRKDPDAEKDWKQEEKGTKEDEVVGWHHQLDWHGFE